MRWRVTAGPWFQNMIAVLEYRRHHGPGQVRPPRGDESGAPHLSTAAEARLS